MNTSCNALVLCCLHPVGSVSENSVMAVRYRQQVWAWLTTSLMCRLGGNYLTLPINRPLNQHHDNHYGSFLCVFHLAQQLWTSKTLKTVICVIRSALPGLPLSRLCISLICVSELHRMDRMRLYIASLSLRLCGLSADGLMNTVKRTEEIDYFPSRNNQTVSIPPACLPCYTNHSARTLDCPKLDRILFRRLWYQTVTTMATSCEGCVLIASVKAVLCPCRWTTQTGALCTHTSASAASLRRR
jgi:hypothetical protein